MPSAFVVAVVGITLIAWVTVVHDGRPGEQYTSAGRRDSVTAIGGGLPSGINPSGEHADTSIRFPSKGEQQHMGTLLTCIICHFEMVWDDVAIDMSKGRGVCLRCYARETSTQLPMPSTLRQALIAILDGITTR
jgi:hypothetical protein